MQLYHREQVRAKVVRVLMLTNYKHRVKQKKPPPGDRVSRRRFRGSKSSLYSTPYYEALPYCSLSV